MTEEESGARVSSDASQTRQRKRRKWDQPAESLVSTGLPVPGALPLGNVGFSVSPHSTIAASQELEFPLELSGYCCGSTTYEELGLGGAVIYHSFVKDDASQSPRSIMKCCWSEDEKDEEVEEKVLSMKN